MIPTGKAVLLMMIDVDPAREAEFNRWYNEEHLPELLALPGFRAARRFLSRADGPRYLAIYEIDDPSALETEAYRTWRAGSRSTEEMRQHIRFVQRGVYTEIFRLPAG